MHFSALNLGLLSALLMSCHTTQVTNMPRDNFPTRIIDGGDRPLLRRALSRALIAVGLEFLGLKRFHMGRQANCHDLGFILRMALPF